MENIIGIDELEAFVLDFLAYRREQRAKASPSPKIVPASTRLLEHKPEANTPPKPHHIPHSIGRGWPYYKDMAGKPPISPSPKPYNTSTSIQNDIIPTLSPIVTDNLNHFGSPDNPKALDHLVHQVIASAMTLPQVNESIRTAELTPWGRVPLLQAVVELLILLHLCPKKEKSAFTDQKGACNAQTKTYYL